MSLDRQALPEMLTRLHLTAIRDQLDSLLDEVAKREFSLREAVAFLCEREVGRRNERRITMATKIAHFPTLRDLDGFDFAVQPSLDKKQFRELAACAGSPTAMRCFCSGRPGSARPTWQSPSAAPPSARLLRAFCHGAGAGRRPRQGARRRPPRGA